MAIRVNTSLSYPPLVPSLIGVKERRYLDHTGLVQQRSIADLMRYAALVQVGVRFETFLNFKILAQLPGFQFTPLEKTIKAACLDYLRIID